MNSVVGLDSRFRGNDDGAIWALLTEQWHTLGVL